MSQHKLSTVKILNPRDSRKYTSRKSAESEVKRGSAEFRMGSLWWIETPRAVFIAGAVRNSAEATYDAAAGSGLASVKALQGLPAIGDVIKMLMIRAQRKAA